MNSKTRTSLSCFVLSLTVACQTGSSYDPAHYLTVPEQDAMMWKIIRYMARPPEGLTFEERFYKGYDDHYHEQMSFHRLDSYYVDENKVNYFLVSRRAPSLTEKRVATGGKLRLDDRGELIEYEEVFRTWKMAPDSLVMKSVFLFDKMVKGENLEPYYTKNSRSTDYIEFPDDHAYFDKTARIWKTK